MHYKGLDLNLLIVLDALFAEKNITWTGERIHLSQSGTSGALARLREFFNDELLVQIANKKMVLTPFAEDLAQPVRDILLQIERVINKVPSFDPKTSSRKLRLMMSDYVASVLMPRVLPRAQQVAPCMTFELLSNAEHPVEFLERGEVDLLIMPFDYTSKQHPSEELFQDPYICMLWKDNPEVAGEITLEHYRNLGHVVVRLGKTQMHVFDEWFLERMGFQRRIEVVSMTFDLLPYLVAGTTRIATVPSRLARRCAAQFPIKLLPTPMEIPPLREVVQWHAYRDTDAALIWFRDTLRSVVAEDDL